MMWDELGAHGAERSRPDRQALGVNGEVMLTEPLRHSLGGMGGKC